MKLLIVDDHAVVREGVAAMLRQAEPLGEILQAEGCDAGLQIAASQKDLAVVILDWAMPGTAGPHAVEAFGRVRPDVPVIVLSASENPVDAQRALDAGALGYVPKTARPTTILLALRLVMAGEMYVPPLLLGNGPASGSNARAAGTIAGRLTERQIDVLGMLAKGLPNKAIANALGVSDKTVKAHITVIFKALDVANRTQAANAARAAGLLK